MQKQSVSSLKRMLLIKRLEFAQTLLHLMLLALVLLLSACQTQPIAPCVTPKLPAMPVSPEPQRSQTFSKDVQDSFSTWQQRLTESQATSKP